MNDTPQRIPTFEDILGLPKPEPESPLKEVSPEALNEIFLKDPRQITDEEIEVLILEYRKQRGQFLIEEKEAKAAGRARKGAKALPKLKEEKKEAVKLSADDINSILGDIL